MASKKTQNVQFKSLTVGENSSNLGFNIEATSMSPDDAKEYFCGTRLSVVIEADDEQMQLAGMEEKPVDALVDVKRFGMSPKWISAALVFSNQDTKVEVLKRFVKQGGKLTFERVGTADDDEGDDD